MYEIEITNFQSIDHCKLVIDGFTTLVGLNHLGKSATLRAINAALTNKQGTDFIKWGEKFCEVRIKCPEFDLLWHKELGNNFYEINGSKRSKVGNEEPPDEIQKVGFKILKVGDQKINLNFIQQFSPLFLVDKQDSKAVDILTSVYGLDVLYDSIGLCNNAQQENSGQLRIREKDIELIDRDLEKFEGFDIIQNRLSEIEENKKLIEVQENCLRKIQDWQKSLMETSRVCRLLKPATELKTPSYASIQNSIVEYSKVIKHRERYNSVLESLKKLESISKVSIPKNEIEEAYKESKILNKLKAWHKSYTETIYSINVLSKAQELIVPNASSVSVEPKAINILRNKFDMLYKTKNEFLTLQKDLESVNVQIKEVVVEMDKFDMCPLCGKYRK